MHLGVAGLFDYGPPGCALQNNIVDMWRKHFVLEEQMLEVDCAIMTPYAVLKTSGHVDRFSDYMTTDVKTGDFFRADHLIEAFFEKRLKQQKDLSAAERAEAESILAQIDGYDLKGLQELINRFGIKSELGKDLTPVHTFNLMFGTDIGPTGQLKGFLRPETAQGQFVNFRRLLEYNNYQMPFASAMIGKSFRNEISPRSGLLRVREFLMAEIEHYVHPQRKQHPKFASVAAHHLNLLSSSTQTAGRSEVSRMAVSDAVSQRIINNETLGYFLVRVSLFLTAIGVQEDRLRFRQHMPNEMAHYASDCWDAEILTSYGWIECVGCADRAAYDLTVHTLKTKERLVAADRLDAPIKVSKVKAIINKRDIGITLKKHSKSVVEHLEALDEEQLRVIMQANAPAYSVKVDDQTFDLNADLFRVELVEELTHVAEYTPNVIEPSFGIGRIIYALLEHSFWSREADWTRCVLSIPPRIAPLKVILLPLSGDVRFNEAINLLSAEFRRLQVAFDVDASSASIGKRYSRNDELGVPFFVTVDFQTLVDATVTVRERDSTEQVRVPIAEAASLCAALSAAQIHWASDVVPRFPLFTQQDLSLSGADC